MAIYGSKYFILPHPQFSRFFLFLFQPIKLLIFCRFFLYNEKISLLTGILRRKVNAKKKILCKLEDVSRFVVSYNLWQRKNDKKCVARQKEF